MVLLIALLVFATSVNAEPSDDARPNVLFLAIDDLRPQLGCYGDTRIKTPNIDSLAADGLLFERAYCQQAVCSPSRTSMLTGLRPDSTKVWDLFTHFRDTVPDVVTLPQHFLRNGYHTESNGKIFHKTHMQDDEHSWSVPSKRGRGEKWVTAKSKEIRQQLLAAADDKKLTGKDRYYATLGPPVEAANVQDNAYFDGHAAELAIQSLRNLSQQEQPFFLAVGFVRPHLPFCAPQKYWDMYEAQEITLAGNPFLPTDCPKYAPSNWGELRHYHGMPLKGPLDNNQSRELIHGYFACISYTDALIGSVLEELDRQGIRDNTLIVLWGDHGWKLGEHGLWCKHTNFELDARVPMILCTPDMKATGQKTNALVELVDVYPTLCELAGLPLPDHLQGTSMTPLLDNPKQSWKKAAFSQFPRGKTMGYSMKTKHYRYTQWVDQKSGKTLARELYDHRSDPEENTNIANIAKNESLIKKLAAQCNAGWQAAKQSIAQTPPSFE